uniref:Uncharacterized protein n=1 Tax=Candidatus Kentrum sp. FW TaxID=2126338 RepID=A0A450SF09_9GAMM|nr:MAG: hypothetical protein BECKFW1821A_GA0114235_103111 [Candidatus Kentron sp. FW]VFJ59639.1 MAG: hypothetical protein BECKFW1821B_GA0114236_104912 [Candidatus Kentron sp. FW]
MLGKLIGRANTPLQRIGLLLLFLSFGLWVLTATHWNIAHEWFIYPYKYTWIEKIKKPEKTYERAYWRESTYGWELLDRACVDENRPTPSVSIDSFGRFATIPPLMYIPPSKCRKQFVSHNRRYRTEWKQSFSSYLDELFDPQRGDYFYITASALVVFFLGISLFLGWADKLFSWIKSGAKS